MHGSFLSSLLSQYHGLMSLYAGIGIIALTLISSRLVVLVPAFAEAATLNKTALQEKMQRPNYAANQKWNRKWSVAFLVVIFGMILPFCLTTTAQPWWKVLLDIVVILMFYDFFYYLVHRFVFHGGGPKGGALMWMHAVHHRQHNPCRWDASYIHPLEVAIGLGLYSASIFVLSRFMGNFHIVTIVITWLAFTEINLHNHDLWKSDRFPIKYLNTMSQMHHNHHANFTGGNYATITLLYDWMFGSLDYGHSKKAAAKVLPQEPSTI